MAPLPSTVAAAFCLQQQQQQDYRSSVQSAKPSRRSVELVSKARPGNRWCFKEICPSQERGGLSRAEDLRGTSIGRARQLLSARLACERVPRHSMKMLQIASVKIDWPRLESGHRPLFNLVPGDGRLRDLLDCSMGRLTCGPGSHFHWTILKKFKKFPSRTTHRPANRPRPRRGGEGTIAAGTALRCADYDPYMQTTTHAHIQGNAPTEQAVPSQRFSWSRPLFDVQ